MGTAYLIRPIRVHYEPQRPPIRKSDISYSQERNYASVVGGSTETLTLGMANISISQ